jgi:probable addiction module antidote protein
MIMKTTRWTFERHFQTDEDITAMIEVAIEENDPKLLSAVIGIVAKKKGMTHVAVETGIKRESLYRALSARGNPEVSTLMKVLPTLGLRLRIEPIPV